MQSSELAQELDALVAQTYSLWEPGWVTFNWREYTYDHVQRVRALALTLARQESAEADILELAALLHDVSKSYDGEYVTDASGQRVVDSQGNWRNLVRPPVGCNEVTELYEALHLGETLHNVSGAALAQHLLQRRGLDEARCDRVATTIRDHLSPPADARAESLCLYDADTIDANIGLPAFVRNIYIHLHFYDVRNPGARPLDELLRDAPLDYLGPYVTEKLKPWSQGKLRDFTPRLRTEAGRGLALARLERLDKRFDEFIAELDAWPQSGENGRLAVVLHYMRHREGASIALETGYLASSWLSTTDATPGARAFVEAIQRESAGLE